MPFTVTNTPPKIDSTVTVRFAGLLLLTPNGDKMCNIHINRQTGHSFQVMLIVTKPNLPLTLLRLTSGPLTRDLKITHSSSTAAFKVFSKDNNPFDRSAADNHANDHRWAINMVDFHPNARANTDNLVELNDGVLYTANLSRPELDPTLQPGDIRLHHIAADLAASFDLTGTNKVSITWEEGGQAKSFELPRIATVDPVGSTYTIVVLNNPPATQPSPHDELDLYYRVLTAHGSPIPGGQRKKLVYDNPQKSDEIPCLSVLLNP